VLLGGRNQDQALAGRVITGLIASAALVGFMSSTKFVTSFTNYMDSFVIWTAAWCHRDHRLLRSQPGTGRRAALYVSPATSRYGDIRWRSLAALLIGLVAG
jgi:hypothetical protein